MTEQPQAPAPGAAPVPAAETEDQSSRAAQLEAELAAIRAGAVKGAKTLLRVLKPHAEFRFGGHAVGTQPTAVPAHAVGPLMEAAENAGVKLEEA